MHSCQLGADRRPGARGLRSDVCRPFESRQWGRGPDWYACCGTNGVLSSSLETARPLENVQVLLAEDDRDIRTLTEVILTAAGAEVHEVADGQAALDLLADFKPDVLLSDIEMPRLNGIQLIGSIRSLDDAELRAIPAIALSAYGGYRRSETAREHGFDVYLTKPVSPAALVHAIVALMRKR